MRKPNKNKMAGVNLRFASVSESIFNGFLLKMLLRSLPVYIVTAVKSIVYSFRSTRETLDTVLFTIRKFVLP